MNKVKIIAEVGINHNGDIDLAKKLITIAHSAGCDYVKFQKRNPDVCVPESEKLNIRQTPWGEMTYLDYKKRIEFGFDEFIEINKLCYNLGIKWFASAWDKDSVDFLSDFNSLNLNGNCYPYADIIKIPSALITDIELCKYARSKTKKLIISTGMSNEEQIIECINQCNPDVIMHTNSTYPCPVEELNLNYINWLKKQHPNKEIGYSGHEYGLVTTYATIPMGVTWIERHITLDRNMWGSDHSASIEPSGLFKLVKGIRDIESALSIIEEPRKIFGGELIKMKNLRK